MDGAARQGGGPWAHCFCVLVWFGLMAVQTHHGHEVWRARIACLLSAAAGTQRRCTTSRPTCATTQAVRTS